MDTRYIYLLRDPETNEVRYVGQTANPDARYELGHKNGGNGIGRKRVKWIDLLAQSGQHPVMEIIEECSAENVDRREFYWILKTALDGAVLTNAKFVPGGKFGYKVTEEQRDGLIRLAEQLNLSRTAVMWLCLEYALKQDPAELLRSALAEYDK